MKTDMELTTDRLVLREWTMEDFGDVQAYATDPEVVRYMSFGPNSEAETTGFLETVIAGAGTTPRSDFTLAVTAREIGQVFGGIGLALKNARSAELGYAFRRDAWGRGYATEAARAVVDFGFRELGLHRIYALCFPPNKASAHVMLKLGMRYEGTLRESIFARGIFWDAQSYSVLAPEWSGAPGAGAP
jgi:RimJ/RimL family protein N-acetyltransferase